VAAVRVVILLLCVIGLAPSAAACRKARPGETPHGANETIVYSEQTVGRLRGTVSIRDGDPVNDVVVEVYRYDGTEAETTKFLNRAKRTSACVTAEDGLFSFKRLKPGRYLLRAGTVAPAGMNEVHLIFRVTGVGKSRNVEIRLTVGT
jgi:protocatechuate 3,4-dioxygenase beta subunit